MGTVVSVRRWKFRSLGKKSIGITGALNVGILGASSVGQIGAPRAKAS